MEYNRRHCEKRIVSNVLLTGTDETISYRENVHLPDGIGSTNSRDDGSIM